MLLPLQATETHCDTVELGSADARFSERVLCLNSNVVALHTVLLVLSPLAVMTQSGTVCLQAATVLLVAQALIRASPLAEKFLSQPLPDEPASGTPPSCLEVALKESFDNNPPEPKFLVQLLNYTFLKILPNPKELLPPPSSTFAAILEALAPACSPPAKHPVALSNEELLAMTPAHLELTDFPALAAFLAPVSHTHREGVIVAFLTALTQPALQARLGIVGVSMDIINGLECVANGVVPAGQIPQPHWPTRVCCLHALLLQFFQIPGNVNDPALKECETLPYYPVLPAGGDHTVLVRATAALNAHITKLWDT